MSLFSEPYTLLLQFFAQSVTAFAYNNLHFKSRRFIDFSKEKNFCLPYPFFKVCNTLIEPKGANKSPLTPLYKRGGFMLPPFIKGDRGGFRSITVERSAYFIRCLYMSYERRFVVLQNPYVPAHLSKIYRFVSLD